MPSEILENIFLYCVGPDPGLPYQGNRIGDDFRHDKTVMFTCPRDYIMEGVRTIKCSDGRWSYRKPSCKGEFYYQFYCLSSVVSVPRFIIVFIFLFIFRLVFSNGERQRCLIIRCGSRDGTVVRALAAHQCVPGSIPIPIRSGIRGPGFTSLRLLGVTLVNQSRLINLPPCERCRDYLLARTHYFVVT